MSYPRDVSEFEFFFFLLLLNFFSPLCQFMNKENVSYGWWGRGRETRMDKSWILFLHRELEQFLTCWGVPKIKKKRQVHREKKTLRSQARAQDKMAHEQRSRYGNNFMFKTIHRSGSRTQVHVNIQYRWKCGTISNSYLSQFLRVFCWLFFNIWRTT